MSTTSPNRTTAELDIFLQICNELGRTASAGTYIYRGEHHVYDKVSSTLYRQCRQTDEEGLGTEAIQEEILKQAKTHAPEMADIDMDETILAELRHNGGETNLIDFTKDYLVALFFACDGAPHKAGQVHI